MLDSQFIRMFKRGIIVQNLGFTFFRVRRVHPDAVN